MRHFTMIVAAVVMTAADYPQFRGPHGNGVADGVDPPTTWNAKTNIAWSVKLPGTGWAQPIVIGNTLFVTAAVSDKLQRPKDMQAGARDMSSMPIPGFGPKPPDADVEWRLIALDAATGKTRWTKSVVVQKPKFPIHPSNTYATETPCADAKRVYAYFGATGTLAAYDHDGKELWRKELGAYPYSNGFGSGSSPTLHDGKLFIASFNEQKSFLVAFDAATGNEIWREQRAKPGSSWATPFVWKNSKRIELIAAGDKLVTSHDPATGRELWRIGGIDTAFAPSPAADGDLLLLGASSPFSASPLFAVKAGANGDITIQRGESTGPFVPWFRNKGGVGMSSPVAAGGYLYIPGEGSLICVDSHSGKQIYKERLPRSRMMTASPVLAGDRLLLLDETGKATWVKTGSSFEVVSTAELNDTFWASPAVVENRVYLRGVDALYCVTKP